MLAGVVIVLAGLAAYANSFEGALVFDDRYQIVENSYVRHFWPPWTAMQATARPIGAWTFAANYAISGLNVRSYHAANLAIHLAAGLVLFGLVRRTLGRVGRGREGPGGTAQTGQPAIRASAEKYAHSATALAMVVALLWTVHPLQTQAVTYIVQRLESLMGLFYLLTLYGFVRAQDARRPWAWYVASVVFCALGMATKEVMATAPVMVLWYDRAFVAASWKELGRRWKYYAALAGTWSILAALMLANRGTYAAGHVFAVEGLAPRSYAASQPGVILHYVALSLWPQSLCFDYAWPIATAPSEILPPAMLIGAMLALTAWCVFRRPAWGFLGGWFFMTLAPTSSVVPIIDLAFEHRMYLASAAVIAAVVAAGYVVGGRMLRQWQVPVPTCRAIAGALVAAIALAMVLRTAVRNRDYRTEESLWADTVEKQPRNVRALTSLGVALATRGRTKEAEARYEEALAIDPRYVEAHDDLGVLLAADQRLDAALAHYKTALSINPEHGYTHFNMGAAMAARGRPDDALMHYRRTTELLPEYAQGHYNLAFLLAGRGDVDDALVHYRRAIELNPEYAEAHNNLAVLLARRGAADEAAAHFRTAIEVKPDYAEARRNLEILVRRQRK